MVRTIEMIRADERPSEVLTAEVLRGFKGRTVRPKSSGQKRYVDAIADNIITFGIGPAGTGKSWLAVAMAVQALQAKEVERIILTRPAVEAGERLGFLPGDLMAKVDPYLRPLYDALFDMVGAEGAERLIERGTVEVAPLAFMRGRTLNGSFIILDEAQNTSPEQMKMFLTRIGFGSKAVITGDTTQVDVQHGRSGLEGLEQILTDIDGLAFVRLGSKDVVRHRIVQDIVDAYDKASLNRSARVSAVAAPVVVARDDQAEEPVDIARWADLATAVLAAEGEARGAEPALRGRGGHGRAQPAPHGPRRPDRRPVLPHRRHAGRRPATGLLRLDVVPSARRRGVCPVPQRPRPRRDLRGRGGPARRPRRPPRPGPRPRRGRRGRGDAREREVTHLERFGR